MSEVIENKKSIHKAHERAFKSAMQDLRVAQDFFMHHLPVAVREKIDFSTLKLHRETFIDPELKELISDMLYSAEFKIDHQKQRIFLYLCVEHQRNPELLMPWRMLKYTVRAVEQHLLNTKEKTLPLIIPLVVYNGDGPYPYSTSVFDLFGDNKALAKAFMFNQFQLIDLTQIPDEEIRQHQWSGFMETLMKHIEAQNIMVYLEQISVLVEHLVASEADDYVLSMIKYAIEKSEMPNRQAFFDWVQSHLSLPLEVKAMTLAEQLRAEGYQQAMTIAEQLKTESYQEGKKALLTRLLTRRFGHLSSKDLLKLEHADAETILVWGERLFDAKNIEDVFSE
jgi:predicted transposase/invertase (TIGR01784 family)